ncbi:hypothetical protein [Kytococcus sp. Marseille-QA3725]
MSDQIITSLERALAAAPDEAFAHILLGSALRAWGRLREALTATTRAVQLDPEGPVGFRMSAITLSDLSRHREAVEAAQEFARLQGQQPDGILPLRALDEMAAKGLHRTHLALIASLVAGMIALLAGSPPVGGLVSWARVFVQGRRTRRDART